MNSHVVYVMQWLEHLWQHISSQSVLQGILSMTQWSPPEHLVSSLLGDNLLWAQSLVSHRPSLALAIVDALDNILPHGLIFSKADVARSKRIVPVLEKVLAAGQFLRGTHKYLLRYVSQGEHRTGFSCTILPHWYRLQQLEHEVAVQPSPRDLHLTTLGSVASPATFGTKSRVTQTVGSSFFGSRESSEVKVSR